MTENRRLSDYDHTVEIEKMIADEPDAHVRVQLLMMHKLINSVATISIIVGDLDEKFSKHAKGEEAILTQIRAVWKIVAWFFGIAVPLLAYVYIDLHNDVEGMIDRYHEDSVAHARFEGRIRTLEDMVKVRK